MNALVKHIMGGLALLGSLGAAGAWADPAAPVLRTAPVVAGPAITLGDLFDNAGTAASRALAPAPLAGQTTALDARFVARAARSAGLDWTPPDGLTTIEVAGSAGTARLEPARAATSPQRPARAAPIIRRGETVVVEMVRPGLTLSLRATALGDAAEGAVVRLRNPSSGRTIEAVAVRPGEARLDTLSRTSGGTAP
jgi:flagella basal body P-ring formation protein FlgA